MPGHRSFQKWFSTMLPDLDIIDGSLRIYTGRNI